MIAYRMTAKTTMPADTTVVTGTASASSHPCAGEA